MIYATSKDNIANTCKSKITDIFKAAPTFGEELRSR